MTIFEALPDLCKLIGKKVRCGVFEREGTLDSIVIDIEDVWYVIVDDKDRKQWCSAVVAIEEIFSE